MKCYLTVVLIFISLMTFQEYLHLVRDNALTYRKDIIIGQGDQTRPWDGRRRYLSLKNQMSICSLEIFVNIR